MLIKFLYLGSSGPANKCNAAEKAAALPWKELGLPATVHSQHSFYVCLL